ncbi:MAG: GYD domain-containing protein [Terracidiphilus sp.]
MPSYLIQASYTTEALATLMKSPQNRTEVVRKAIEKLGGSLTGLWLSFGDQDIVSIMEMPDNVTAAAISLAIASGGALKCTKTTPLLTVEEGMAAMKKAASSGYKPISAKK